jgi:hypothetical protein
MHTLTDVTREALRERLSIELHRYDRDQRMRAADSTKRPVYYNPFALGLYLEALGRAMDSLKFEGVAVEMALAENFEGYLLRVLLKVYARMMAPHAR